MRDDERRKRKPCKAFSRFALVGNTLPKTVWDTGALSPELRGRGAESVGGETGEPTRSGRRLERSPLADQLVVVGIRGTDASLTCQRRALR